MPESKGLYTNPLNLLGIPAPVNATGKLVSEAFEAQ